MVLEKAKNGFETSENVEAMSPIRASDMLKILLNTDTIRRVPVKRITPQIKYFLHSLTTLKYSYLVVSQLLCR